MTFKEFLNQKDFGHTLPMKTPEMGSMQVVKAYHQDAPSNLTKLTEPPPPKATPARPAMSALGGGGRSFFARIKTTPRKPSHFLPRKGAGDRKGL